MLVSMDEEKQTDITLKSSSPVGISSRAYGANIDGAAFNLDFIASIDPNFATEIVHMLDKARRMKANGPAHPEEDFAKAFNDLNLPKLLSGDKD